MRLSDRCKDSVGLLAQLGFEVQAGQGVRVVGLRRLEVGLSNFRASRIACHAEQVVVVEFVQALVFVRNLGA